MIDREPIPYAHPGPAGPGRGCHSSPGLPREPWENPADRPNPCRRRYSFCGDRLFLAVLLALVCLTLQSGGTAGRRCPPCCPPGPLCAAARADSSGRRR